MNLVIRLIVGIVVAVVIVWLLGAALVHNDWIAYVVALLAFLAIVFAAEPVTTRWRR